MYWWLVSVPSLSATHENLLISPRPASATSLIFHVVSKLCQPERWGISPTWQLAQGCLPPRQKKSLCRCLPHRSSRKSTASASLGLSATEMTPAAPSDATCPAISGSSTLQASLNLPDLDASGQNLFCLIDKQHLLQLTQRSRQAIPAVSQDTLEVTHMSPKISLVVMSHPNFAMYESKVLLHECDVIFLLVRSAPCLSSNILTHFPISSEVMGRFVG